MCSMYQVIYDTQLGCELLYFDYFLIMQPAICFIPKQSSFIGLFILFDNFLTLETNLFLSELCCYSEMK